MNIKEIKELIDLVEKSQLVELELEKSGVRIKIVKGRPNPVLPHPASVEAVPLALSPSREKPSQQTGNGKPGEVTVVAPVVGTFYRSSSPEASSYVEVGSHVKKGQVLCVIEAMKLMNEIEAECDGIISAILVENSLSVEYGQPLFLINPDSETK